ncbi:ABC transporter permease [Candidatus Woesearchaeota archaeon]|nr:ABC transporter permease [Candidatus Woesearchaeota archaeon]
MNYIINLAALIRKNLIVLLRARTSALIVLIGPLLLILLAGMAFDNTNTYAVSVGIYSEKYNELSNAFTQRLTDNRIRVTKFESIDQCASSIRKGDTHLCIQFSKDMTVGKNATMEFYVDHSRINLVWTIINVMTQRVMERNYELSKNLTTILLKAVETAKTESERIKPIVISITTDNELITKETGIMQAELLELNTAFDSEGFKIDELSKKKQIIKQWIENAITIGQESLKNAQQFINVAYQEQSNEDVKAALAKAVSDLESQKTRLEETKKLSDEEFKRITELFETLIKKIRETETQVKAFSDAQKTSRKSLEQIKIALQKSLIALAEIQRGMNNIDTEIDKITIKDPGSIAQPIETIIRPVVAEKTYLQYLFPTLILLVIMFTSLILPPTLILLEKKSPALIRNYLTPTKNYTYLLATFLSIYSLLILQILIVLVISGIFFKTQVIAGLPETIFVLLITTALFILLGMLVGYLLNTEETAMLTSTAISVILLSMSDTIIPIETMPTWMIEISKLNPFVTATGLLRQTLVYQTISGTGKGILIFVLYLILAVILVWLACDSANREIIKGYLAKLKGKTE